MTLRTYFAGYKILVLQIVTLVNVLLPNAALATSPSFNHQEISNVGDWETIDGQEQADDIHDGRKIFFNENPKVTQCINNSLFGKFPNITSVSYSSDGKTINSTFWLNQRPLANDYFQALDRASELEQVYLHLNVEDIVPPQKTTINQTEINQTEAEVKFIKETFHDVIVTKINNSRPARLGTEEATKIEFRGNLNYTTLGHPEVYGMDTFTTKNDELFRMIYLAQPDQFNKQLTIVNKILDSFRIRSDNNNAQSSTTRNLTNSPPVVPSNTNEGFFTYYVDGIKISIPSDWGIYRKEGFQAIFFSPIEGPYLTDIGYIVSLDVPSVYETDTDYVSKVLWSDSLYKRTWSNLLEEASSTGTMRTLKETPNFTASFEEQKNYERPRPHVLVPIDLRLANFPDQLLMVFITEARFIRDGYLCDLVQKTGQVSAPPPKFIISPSVNSTSIGPRETKTIEVKVTSLTDIPYNIKLSIANSSEIMDMTFNPTTITVPPSGWATSKLTLKSNGNIAGESTKTETARIVAQPSLTEKGNMIKFTNRSIETYPALIPNNYSLGLTVTNFNLVDGAIHFLNSISAPVGVAVALAGLIGTGVGWLLNRRKKQTTSFTFKKS
jgi:hypothetical protein